MGRTEAEARFKLLREAIESGKSTAGDRFHTIIIERNGNRVKRISFQLFGQIITEYTPDNGAITNNCDFTALLDDLSKNNAKDVLINCQVIDLAVKEGILPGKPTRNFKLPEPRFNGEWIEIDEPIRVKHRIGSDGGNLFTIPIPRKVSDRLSPDDDNWIVYAFKIVKTPKKPKLRGGRGRCQSGR